MSGCSTVGLLMVILLVAWLVLRANGMTVDDHVALLIVCGVIFLGVVLLPDWRERD